MDLHDDQLVCHDLKSKPCPDKGIVLVSGATGYIGGRLVPELLARNYRVRVIVRVFSPEQKSRWPGAEIVVADARDLASLDRAMKGVFAAYYLIHSLLLGQMKFGSVDMQVAENFRIAAEKNNVCRVIYLCGLGVANSKLSQHLSSRMKVAEELSKGSYVCTVLRAAIIIGSGSASYEIVKDLANNLPVLVLPKWANTRCQPISIRDVIKYLVGILEQLESDSRYYDIGGADVLTYKEMMQTIIFMQGRKKPAFSIPVNNTSLFGYLGSFFTSVPAPITQCLFEGCKNEVICEDNTIRNIVPFAPLPYKEAILRAMSREEQDKISTRWSDAYPPAHDLALKLRELTSPPRFVLTHIRETEKSQESLCETIRKIGGRQGWMKYNWLWKIRGGINKLFLGIGSSRGRRSKSTLRINDVIDYWRVEDMRPNYLLLRRELKLPGKAWLEFRIRTRAHAGTAISIRAFYHSESMLGKIYWYAFKPFHSMILRNLLKEIDRRSQ